MKGWAWWYLWNILWCWTLKNRRIFDKIYLMDLLQTRDEKKVDLTQQESLEKEILDYAKENNIKFIGKKWAIVALLSIIFPGVVMGYFYFTAPNIDFNLAWAAFMAFLILGVPFGGVIFSAYRLINADKKNKKQIEKFGEIRYKILSETFNNRYQDIKLIGKISEEEIKEQLVKNIKSIRSNSWINGEKANSSFSRAYEGYIFRTKNNVILKAFQIEAMEQHPDSKNNTNTESFDYICFLIENVPEKWQKFNFSISKGGNSYGELENEEFNRNWNYFAEDPVYLRRILTPWTQEQLLKTKFKFTFKYEQGLMHWYGKNNQKIFEFNGKLTKSIQESAIYLAKDILEDLVQIEKLIQDISAFKTIIN